MSASEKLKALEPDIDDVLWGANTQSLWDTLPQIVAVVEANEEMAEIYREIRGDWKYDGTVASRWLHALDALEAALGA